MPNHEKGRTAESQRVLTLKASLLSFFSLLVKGEKNPNLFPAQQGRKNKQKNPKRNNPPKKKQNPNPGSLALH